jgi:hypothetical protein
MDKDSSKLNKMIDDWNKYLDKLKQEEEQSLAMIYDYDIEPLPNDVVDMVENETENDLENARDFKIDKWGFDKSSK